MPAVLAASQARSALWYLTRGTGVVSLVLLTGVMILGIVATVGWSSRTWPRFVSQGLHRNLSLLSVVLVAVHVVTTVADGFAPIGYLDAVVPFRSPYRPVWLGLGTLAFDVMIAVIVTSALRPRIGYTSWRYVHWLSYACWPLAVFHTLGTGTDVRLSPMLALDAVCVIGVLGALAWRLSVGVGTRSPRSVPDSTVRARRYAAGAVALAVVIGAGVFTVLGPLRPGWALRAGTPVSVLARLTAAGSSSQASSTATGGGAGSSTTASTTPPPTSPSTSPPGAGAGASPGSGIPALPFDAQFTGTVSTSPPDASGNVSVDIHGSLSSGASGTLDVTLVGPPADGGVNVVSSQVTLGSARGAVSILRGTRIAADLTAPDGTQFTVNLALSIDQNSGSVTGTVRGSAGAGEGRGQ